MHVPALYTLDDRSVTGFDRIDSQHIRIAAVCRDLDAALAAADFDTAYRIFLDLFDTLLDHFETEEEVIARYARNPEVQKHLYRHRANHQIVREHLSEARRAFLDAARTTRRIPDLVSLAPRAYFDQMKDVDAEMTALLARYR